MFGKKNEKRTFFIFPEKFPKTFSLPSTQWERKTIFLLCVTLTYMTLHPPDCSASPLISVSLSFSTGLSTSSRTNLNNLKISSSRSGVSPSRFKLPNGPSYFYLTNVLAFHCSTINNSVHFPVVISIGLYICLRTSNFNFFS